MGVIPTDFRGRAERYLADWTVQTALAQANVSDGYWHPAGFMTFHTALRFDGAPVQVHCWSAHRRPVEPGHPPIHTHVWPLASKVVHGVYSEALYRMVPSHDGALVEYEVEYHGGPAATVTAGDRHLEVVERRGLAFATGEVHFVEAGEWHETTIPADERVVTVMVTGRPEHDQALLAGPAGFPTRLRSRPVVSQEDLLAEFGELMSAPTT